MKKLLLTICLLFSIITTAQEDKTVTLTVTGTGKTIEEAKLNALRSAIEQAFGAFISSKTEILNDDLVKDEIVSVTNGNVQKYEVVSQVEIPNNGFSLTVSAKVSITNLKTYAKSKGVSIEFNGGLFADNIALQKLNESAEIKAISNFCFVADELLKNSTEFEINYNNPYLLSGDKEDYVIDLLVNCSLNQNILQFQKYFLETLKSISMSDQEVRNYNTLNKDIHELHLVSRDYKSNFRYLNKDKDFDQNFYFRNKVSFLMLKNLIVKSQRIMEDFEIDLGIVQIFVNNTKNNCNVRSNSSSMNPYENLWVMDNKGLINGSFFFTGGEYLMCTDIYGAFTRLTDPYVAFKKNYIFSSNLKTLIVFGTPQYLYGKDEPASGYSKTDHYDTTNFEYYEKSNVAYIKLPTLTDKFIHKYKFVSTMNQISKITEIKIKNGNRMMKEL